jgi:transcriptional regulator with XRE-family HTH domain
MLAKRKDGSFGQMIRNRRRQLHLTQQEIARRIETSTPYVGHLELSKRNPSDKVTSRLAKALGLDHRELFFLANPQTMVLLKPTSGENKKPTWEEFRKDDGIRRVNNITSGEMKMLEKVSLLGELSSVRDFIYILNTVRHVLRVQRRA